MVDWWMIGDEETSGVDYGLKREGLNSSSAEDDNF